MEKGNDRRRFTRIGFKAPCRLIQDQHSWDAKVIDVSINGLLIERPKACLIDTRQQLEACIRLNEADAINMTVSLAHGSKDYLGFKCEQLDLESMTHLRRLVELNLGSEDLLRRELSVLIATFQEQSQCP